MSSAGHVSDMNNRMKRFREEKKLRHDKRLQRTYDVLHKRSNSKTKLNFCEFSVEDRIHLRNKIRKQNRRTTVLSLSVTFVLVLLIVLLFF